MCCGCVKDNERRFDFLNYIGNVIVDFFGNKNINMYLGKFCWFINIYIDRFIIKKVWKNYVYVKCVLCVLIYEIFKKLKNFINIFYILILVLIIYKFLMGKWCWVYFKIWKVLLGILL